MKALERYIDNKVLLPRQIDWKPDISLKICVVIPCCNESDLLETLSSLASCNPTKSTTEIIVVLNSSEGSPDYILENNSKTLDNFNVWQRENNCSWLKFHIIDVQNVPEKFAGAGRARKIGMDEAIRRFYQINYEDGIIVSLDADCIVRDNYLTEIENSFLHNPDYNFFTISFAHPTKHPDIDADLKEGIIHYELYMRYYRHALRYSGFPHSIYTVGSCFAVKASAYIKQGGMNSRKAGEDFYFLQKMVYLNGNYGEISNTHVIPATRISDRVPFGTGTILKSWANGDFGVKYTYDFNAFIELKPFLLNVKKFFNCSKQFISEFARGLHPSLHDFIKSGNTIEDIINISNNCSSAEIFEKRFFHYINAFWILKYLNFSHQQYFKKGLLEEESVKLLQKINYAIPAQKKPEILLDIFRQIDNTIDI